ncbi:MAG TPA: MMPL family transporter, partial [Streptosporangiaceae bacterium]
AVATAAHHTGTTVTSAGLILAATFGTAAITGATSQIKQLSTAIALGVLIDTFLVRTLMVPAVVVICGRRNWWPSKLGRPGVTRPDVAGKPRPAGARA